MMQPPFEISGKQRCKSELGDNLYLQLVSGGEWKHHCSSSMDVFKKKKIGIKIWAAFQCRQIENKN